MALIVHITEQCRKEARNHSFEQALDRFKERVEESQDTRYFDPFPHPISSRNSSEHARGDWYRSGTPST